MAGKSNRFSRFWQELKHRKSDRVVVAYAASAFVILQLTEILADALYFPSWTKTLVIIVLAIGFPVSAIFSWLFDITPGGIERTKPLNSRKKQQIESELRTWKEVTLASLIIIIALLVFNIISKRIESDEIRKTQKSLAVLPFEEIGNREEPAVNGDGITTIITTGLSEIEEFDVRPRSVVMKYKTFLERKRRNKSIAIIARKLNVFFIVTGELVRTGDKLIVSVNLLMAKKTRVLLARNYSITPENNFEQINKIIYEIASTLKTVPTPEEKQNLNNKPTRSGLAYINYIKASASQDNANSASVYLTKGDSVFNDLSAREYFNRAIELYGKAIEADSGFALAYAKRAITRSWGVHTKQLKVEDHKDKCRYDISMALSIDKNLTEAKVANGFYYYYFLRDYRKALTYFEQASADEPRKWQWKYNMALVLRAMGNWDSSQDLIHSIIKHNIQDPLFLTNIGLSYQAMHMYDSAVYFHDKAIELMPGWSSPYYNKIESLILRDGNTSEAEKVVDTALLKVSGCQFQKLLILFDIYNRKFEDALVKTENTDLPCFDDQGDKFLIYAKIYDNLNDKKFAEEYYGAALDFYKNLLTEEPESSHYLSRAGIASAGLKNKKAAIESALEAVKKSGDNYMEKSWRNKDLAQVYVMTGEFDKAINLLEDLLANPSDLSPKILQTDPVWDPLGENNRFRQLLQKYN